ncbi:MAG: hypothetical protein KGN77_04695, partial [Xanthomonadaceae bacterium]|nr:hypothetical protein [Xanthomonadaceae bacterium]
MPRLLVRFAALGIGLASFVGMAQDAPARNAAAARATADPQQPMRHLSRLLDLTPEQVATLAPVIAQRQQQLAGLRGDTSLDRRERRERL